MKNTSNPTVCKAEPAATVDPLLALFEAAVERAFERRWPDLLEIVNAKPQKRLRDTGELAVELGLSTPSIGKLVKQGMPHVMAGQCRRFDADECLEWLRQRTDGAR